MFARRLLIGHLLKVVRQDDGRHRPVGERDATSPVDQMADLRRGRGLLDEITGDVLEKGGKIKFLLIVAA